MYDWWNREFSYEITILLGCSRMSDEIIPKVLMYIQLDIDNTNVYRPCLRYKEELKSKLAAVKIGAEKKSSRKSNWSGKKSKIVLSK